MKIFQGIPFYNYFSNKNDNVNIKVFSYYKSIQRDLKADGIDLILGFIGSEGDISKRLVESLLDDSSFYYEFCQENKTLADKFNYCLEVGKEFDPDMYCISGSNDMVTKIFYSILDKSKDLSGVSWSDTGVNYIIDINSRSSFLSKGKYQSGLFNGVDHSKLQLVGGIYALSKRFLDICSWKPFSLPYDEVGMEYSIYSIFKDLNLEVNGLSHPDLKLYNIKGNYDLTGYDLCKQIHFYRDLNEEEINYFFKMWEELKI